MKGNCTTCTYWKRFFHRYTEDWIYRCEYVIDHYQARPDSKGVDVYLEVRNDDNDCEYWEEK